MEPQPSVSLTPGPADPAEVAAVKAVLARQPPGNLREHLYEDSNLIALLIYLKVFSRDDLRMMLRGGMLHEEGDPFPCQDPERDVYQIRPGPAQNPNWAPAARLACPIQERAGAEDALVPCTVARRNFLPEEAARHPPRDGREAAVSLLFQKERVINPCTVLGTQAGELLEPLIRGRRPAPSPEEQEVQRDLVYLRDSGRLHLSEMAGMIAWGLVTEDEKRLPCAGTPRSEARRPHLPGCPLLARAALGDKTVPCAHAQKVGEDKELHSYLEWLGVDQVIMWLDSKDHEAEDPVVERRIRPCHLLGRLIATRLWRHYQELSGRLDITVPSG